MSYEQRQHRIKSRLDRIKKAQLAAFTTGKYSLATPQTFCGTAYEYQPHGGGSRYHCPSCNVRRGSGRTLISWTNGHIARRFCNNLTN